jgi:hypothetical protein
MEKNKIIKYQLIATLILTILGIIGAIYNFLVGNSKVVVIIFVMIGVLSLLIFLFLIITQKFPNISDYRKLARIAAMVSFILTIIIVITVMGLYPPAQIYFQEAFSGTITPTATPTATFTPTPTSTATFIPTPTPTATFTPTATPTATYTPSRIGSSPGQATSFPIYPEYDPSGIMGDVGDVHIQKYQEFVRFIYETSGLGPHEWEYKYIGGNLNSAPAKFAGVMYLNPKNNWCTDLRGGYDLRGFRTIKWEARSVSGEVNTEFVFGGVNWRWDDVNKVKQNCTYPDSLPSKSMGIKLLNATWQEFRYDLTQLSDDDLRYVVGGFGWVINWESEGVRFVPEKNGSDKSKTITIELRNIRYEK